MAGGLFLDASGTALNRWSNLRATSLTVNACAFFTPIISLALLLATGHGGIAHPALFLPGAAQVLTSTFALRSR